jgi:hypothetical protein
MTLAAVSVEPDVAAQLLLDFRARTGLTGELKGSRIDLDERALFFDLFGGTNAHAIVGVAISAVRPAPGEDRGDHDQRVYAALLDDAVAALLPKAIGCTDVIIDDGRYDQATLAPIRVEIARLIGPCGLASLELSHRLAELQIADVIANTFFNRALVSPRQSRMARAVAPFLDSGKIEMRVLGPAG